MRPGNTYGVVAIVRTQAKLVPNLVFACNLRSCCRCTALARHTRTPGMTIAHAPLNFWSGVWRSTPLPVKASDWRTSTPLTPLTINTSSKWFKPSEELMPFRFHRKSTSSLEFYNSTLPRIDVILSSANVIAAPRSDLIGPSRCKRRVTNRMRQPISATCRYDLLVPNARRREDIELARDRGERCSNTEGRAPRPRRRTNRKLTATCTAMILSGYSNTLSSLARSVPLKSKPLVVASPERPLLVGKAGEAVRVIDWIRFRLFSPGGASADVSFPGGVEFSYGLYSAV